MSSCDLSSEFSDSDSDACLNSLVNFLECMSKYRVRRGSPAPTRMQYAALRGFLGGVGTANTYDNDLLERISESLVRMSRNPRLHKMVSMVLAHAREFMLVDVFQRAVKACNTRLALKIVRIVAVGEMQDGALVLDDLFRGSTWYTLRDSKVTRSILVKDPGAAQRWLRDSASWTSRKTIDRVLGISGRLGISTDIRDPLVVQSAICGPEHKPNSDLLRLMLESGVAIAEDAVFEAMKYWFTGAMKFLLRIGYFQPWPFFTRAKSLITSSRLREDRCAVEACVFLVSEFWMPELDYKNVLEFVGLRPDQWVYDAVNLVFDNGCPVSNLIFIETNQDGSLDFIANPASLASVRVYYATFRILETLNCTFSAERTFLLDFIKTHIARETFCAKDPGFLFLFWSTGRLPRELRWMVMDALYMVNDCD